LRAASARILFLRFIRAPSGVVRPLCLWYHPRKEKRVESRRFTITTLIAIIALLVAIVGLLSDIGLLSLPQVPRPILQPVSIEVSSNDWQTPYLQPLMPR